MVREDLVEGAVAFLQDPSVASAPLEQRISFLRSKNLTQDEIDASLARVGQAPSSGPPPVQYRQPPPQYQTQQQYGYPQQWQQVPPEPPQRDWRDYFIAATVMGGVGYGLYWTAKRYILPVIAPPTPPQLEQDKASVDASFEKAFALLEQLATDTQELKDAESMRKERLDAALVEIESVISRMKQANEEREAEAKRMSRELMELKEQIPRAIEKEKETTDNRLKDLNLEMKSLKTLVANRVQGGGVGAAVPPGRASPTFASSHNISAPSNSSGITNGTSITSGSTADSVVVPEASAMNGSATPTERASSMPFSSNPNRDGAGTPYSRLLGGKSAIPSWQIAAAKKKTDEAAKDGAALNGGSATVQNSGESGTMIEETQ